MCCWFFSSTNKFHRRDMMALKWKESAAINTFNNSYTNTDTHKHTFVNHFLNNAKKDSNHLWNTSATRTIQQQLSQPTGIHTEREREREERQGRIMYWKALNKTWTGSAIGKIWTIHKYTNESEHLKKSPFFTKLTAKGRGKLQSPLYTKIPHTYIQIINRKLPAIAKE